MSGSVTTVTVSTTLAVAGATVLPNTGASHVITAAATVAVFLLTWGVMIARSNR